MGRGEGEREEGKEKKEEKEEKGGIPEAKFSPKHKIAPESLLVSHWSEISHMGTKLQGRLENVVFIPEAQTPG